MIATRLKNRVPQFLSYPMSAKVISQALAEVPQYPMLKLNFWCRPGVFRNPQRTFEVFTAEYHYHKASRFSARNLSDWHEARWDISIYAVPRSLKHQMKTLLLDEGLVRVSELLKRQADAHGHEGTRRLTILFDPGFEILRFDEFSSVDSRTVRTR